MTTLGDLPVTDPSIFRLLGSLWIGDVKIKPDTVLDKKMIRDKIKMFETADICNSAESASVAQAIKDLEQLLTYL
jgi:hypothetical protein